MILMMILKARPGVTQTVHDGIVDKEYTHKLVNPSTVATPVRQLARANCAIGFPYPSMIPSPVHTLLLGWMTRSS